MNKNPFFLAAGIGLLLSTGVYAACDPSEQVCANSPSAPQWQSAKTESRLTDLQLLSATACPIPSFFPERLMVALRGGDQVPNVDWMIFRPSPGCTNGRLAYMRYYGNGDHAFMLFKADGSFLAAGADYALPAYKKGILAYCSQTEGLCAQQ